MTTSKLISCRIRLSRFVKSGHDLALTMRFGEERTTQLLTDVVVAVRGVRIFFELKNCTMPDREWLYDAQIPSERRSKRTKTVSLSDSSTQGGGSTVGAKISTTGPAIEISDQSTTTANKSAGDEIVDEYDWTQPLVVASGNSASPAWDIRASNDAKVLRGSFGKDAKFAVVEPRVGSWNMEGYLSINQPDVFVMDRNGEFAQSTKKGGFIQFLVRREICGRARKFVNFGGTHG